MGQRPQHTRKNLEKVLLLAELQGWTVTKSGKQHFKMKCPCGAHLKWVSSTPSDPNYERNLRRELVRKTCWEELGK